MSIATKLANGHHEDDASFTSRDAGKGLTKDRKRVKRKINRRSLRKEASIHFDSQDR